MTLLTLQNTGLVIDSTTDPWPHFQGRPNIAVVPLKVLFGDEAYDDGTEMGIDQFFEKLASSTVMPTSSQPTPDRFETAYAEMCDRFENVYSIHISAEMSGTVGVAREVAERFPRVRVFDSRTASGGCGLLVERVHAKLAEGIADDDLEAYFQHYLRRGRFVIHAASLEHLRRGGRIGRAQSMVGGMLGIHPLVHLEDGMIAPYAKARGERRAVDLMMQYFLDNASRGQRVYVGLLHGAKPLALPILRERILALRPDAQIVLSGSIGSVVGVHIGPGPAAIMMIAE
jgi:DegV family protein with EDD domain